MKYLSICIPNYNRIDKLEKLVKESIRQIEKYSLENDVEICVSDDCSAENPVKLINEIMKQYPHISITYVRNEVNRGMDYNFLNSVMIADSLYCWIIGNDDLPVEDGIQIVVNKLKQFEDKIDILVTPFDVYKDDNEIINTIQPLRVELNEQVLFDTANQNEYLELLMNVQHNSGLFGFLSNTVFKKEKWVEYREKFQDKLNTIFIQMYMNIQTLQVGAKYLYMPDKIIKNYSDDDTNNLVKRICDILFGLDGVIEYFFDGEIKNRLKGVIVDAYVSGIVWDLPDTNKYKQMIMKLDSDKNKLYKEYYISTDKRKDFFAGKEVFIFGAGKYGERALQELEDYNIKIKGIIDSDPSKKGKQFGKYTIQFPKEMINEWVDTNVIVVANHFHLVEMVCYLLENNINKIALIC